MQVNNSITTQPFAPVLTNQEGNAAVNPGLDDKVVTSEFSAAWHQALARADDHAPALADNLRRMVVESPDAIPLYLANVTAQNQRDLAAAKAKIGQIDADTFRASGASDLLGGFERVLENANARNVENNQEYLAKYSQYMVAISQLMAELNSKVEAGEEGKSNVNGERMIRALKQFCDEWKGEKASDKGTIGVFKTREEAQAAANRFRGKTAEVFEMKDEGAGDPNKFGVRFSFDRFAPIITSLVDPRHPEAADAIKKRLIGHLKSGNGPNFDDIPAHQLPAIKSKDTNAHGVQSITLAMNDVQKTHQTDLDLLLNDFSRAVSQFDNLVKLYSSLATTLTETCKSFL